MHLTLTLLQVSRDLGLPPLLRGSIIQPHRHTHSPVCISWGGERGQDPLSCLPPSMHPPYPQLPSTMVLLLVFHRKRLPSLFIHDSMEGTTQSVLSRGGLFRCYRGKGVNLSSPHGFCGPSKAGTVLARREEGHGPAMLARKPKTVSKTTIKTSPWLAPDRRVLTHLWGYFGGCGHTV